jgi:hypothetical protein
VYELKKMMIETVAGLAIIVGAVLGLNALAGACEPQLEITPQSVAAPGPTGNLSQPEPEINEEIIPCTNKDGMVIKGCWIK